MESACVFYAAEVELLFIVLFGVFGSGIVFRSFSGVFGPDIVFRGFFGVFARFVRDLVLFFVLGVSVVRPARFEVLDGVVHSVVGVQRDFYRKREFLFRQPRSKFGRLFCRRFFAALGRIARGGSRRKVVRFRVERVRLVDYPRVNLGISIRGYRVAVRSASVLTERNITRRRKVAERGKVFFAGVEHGFADGQPEARVVVTLDKIPQIEALTEVLVLDDRVGAKHGRIDVLSVHIRHKLRSRVLAHDRFEFLESSARFGRGKSSARVFATRRIVLDFYRHSRAVEALAERSGISHFAVFFVRGELFRDLASFGHEQIQPRDKRVQKLVLVSKNRILAEHVQ